MGRRDWLDVAVGTLMTMAVLALAIFSYVSWWAVGIAAVADALLVGGITVRRRGRRN